MRSRVPLQHGCNINYESFQARYLASEESSGDIAKTKG